MIKWQKVQASRTLRTSHKNIRFPDQLIAQVEEAIRGTDVTFSAFVIEAVRVALENLAEDE